MIKSLTLDDVLHDRAPCAAHRAIQDCFYRNLLSHQLHNHFRHDFRSPSTATRKIKRCTPHVYRTVLRLTSFIRLSTPLSIHAGFFVWVLSTYTAICISTILFSLFRTKRRIGIHTTQTNTFIHSFVRLIICVLYIRMTTINNKNHFLSILSIYPICITIQHLFSTCVIQFGFLVTIHLFIAISQKRDLTIRTYTVSTTYLLPTTHHSMGLSYPAPHLFVETLTAISNRIFCAQIFLYPNKAILDVILDYLYLPRQAQVVEGSYQNGT
jgi:hypothetical protein